MNEEKIETLKFLINLQEAETERIDKIYSGMIEESGGWVLKAFDNHLKLRMYTIDKNVKILLLYIANGAIGTMITLLQEIDEWQKSNLTSNIDWITYIMHIGDTHINKLVDYEFGK